MARDHFVHRKLVEHFHVEETGWAPDLVRAAASRLNGARPQEPLEPVVLWLGQFAAFTVGGEPFIYVGREILSRGLTEPGVAFVLAHEMAHHDLGHCEIDDRSFLSIASSWLSVAFDRIRYGPEHELEADRYALDLCFAADYDETGAFEFFDLARRVALDYRDLDAVFEPDSPRDGTVARLIDWAGQSLRSHPSLERRAEALRRLV